MNKIKVIDLLNMISKGEEMPKKILLNGIVFEYQGDDYLYKDEDKKEHWLFSASYTDKYTWLENFLNYEVELIEEDKNIEIPKHIPNEVIQDLDRAICPANVKCIAHKVNELINYLQHTNKGDSNK